MKDALRRIALPLVLLIGVTFWLLPLVNALLMLGSLLAIVVVAMLAGQIRGPLRDVLDSRVTHLVAVAVVLIAGATVPYWAGDYGMRFFSEMLILGLLAMSLDVMMGYIGLASFAHAALAGIASYGTAIALTRFGWSPWPAIAFAMLLGTLATTVMGVFSVRVRDIYFGIITLMFGVLAFIIANTWVSVTKGEDGITVALPKLSLAGLYILDTRNLTSFWYLTFVAVVASYIVLRRLMRSPIGLVFRGIRENEQKAGYLGYGVNAYKILNTAISGFFTSIAGVLLLLKNGIIGTEQMDVLHSGEVVIWSVIGGVGTLIGPFIGAAFVFALTDYLGQFTQRYVLIVGLIFIVTILLAPKGIIGVLMEAWRPAGEANKEDAS